MLRVMTINLYNGRADASSLAALLDEVRPGLLAAQELAPDAAAVIAERLPHGRLLPSLDHRGRGLASRREIDVEDLPLPHRPGLRGRLQEAGREVEAISVHLANPVDAPRPRLAERRRQVAALLPVVARPGVRVLMGDLNSTPVWPAYRQLTGHLTDVVAAHAAERGTRPLPTWGYRPWLPAVLRIDHVLAAGMKAVAVQVRRIRGADHRAVVADLELE